MVTIRTVAEYAGVSISTVSRVLNSPDKVSPETRERVMKAVRALNYHPNEVARKLSSKKPQSIGLLVPYISSLFVGELYKGVSTAAWERGLNVLLHDSSKGTKEGLIFLKQHNVDGIVLASSYISEEYKQIVSWLGIPVVLVLTESPHTPSAAFKVDDVQAAYDAVKYLIARGHRRIAMISGPLTDLVSGRSRFNGYRKALEHYGLPYLEQQVACGDYRYDHGYAAMNELLAHRESTRFTAVFAASDEMAIGAIRCIEDHGLRVPDDISVMGYDNLSIADMVKPKLTTIAQPFERIGADAVHFLVDVLEGERPNSGVRYLPHQIIGRESVKEISSLDEPPGNPA
jgi:LacI family transcriptional regulator